MKKVLFLCTKNSARSQMAEGLVRHLYGDRFEVHSAGTEKSVVHPLAIEALSEIGIDISGHHSKSVEQFKGETFDYVITLCGSAEEQCPHFPGKNRHIHKAFADPAAVEGSEREKLDAFRKTRDEIKAWVRIVFKDYPFKENKSAKPAGAKFRFCEFLAEKIITTVAFLSLAFIVLIFVFVFKEASSLFYSKPKTAQTATVVQEQETYGEEITGVSKKPEAIMREARDERVSASNLLGTVWQPVSLEPRFGLWPLMAGSFKVTLVAVLFGGPIAILSAIFSSAFAPKWMKEVLKPAIELLAGFPSVVIGFFALIFLASFFQKTFGFHYRLNAFVGGIALSLAVIPIIYTISEDALSAVPKNYTEASLALGAQKWETVLFVVFPAAIPGIFAAVLLGIGRAFGETMIVLMATGNAALLSWNIFEPVRTMSATIGAEMAEVVFGDIHYSVLFLIGVILFLFSFGLNALAELYVRQRLMKRFKGS